MDAVADKLPPVLEWLIVASRIFMPISSGFCFVSPDGLFAQPIHQPLLTLHALGLLERYAIEKASPEEASVLAQAIPLLKMLPTTTRRIEIKRQNDIPSARVCQYDKDSFDSASTSFLACVVPDRWESTFTP